MTYWLFSNKSSAKARLGLLVMMLLAVSAWSSIAAGAAGKNPAERARAIVEGRAYQNKLPFGEAKRRAGLPSRTATSSGQASSGGVGRSESPARKVAENQLEDQESEALESESAPSQEQAFTLPSRTGSTLPSLGGLAWVLGLFLVFCLVMALVVIVAQAIDRRRYDRGGSFDDEALVVPREAAAALVPLADVAAMADAGEFGEAVHLLLQHALRALAERTGARFAPSLTSREVLRGAKLEKSDRALLEALVVAVERSFFGGQAVRRSDYEKCRHLFDQFLEPQAT